jgi:hypothetical protein
MVDIYGSNQLARQIIPRYYNAIIFVEKSAFDFERRLTNAWTVDQIWSHRQ